MVSTEFQFQNAQSKLSCFAKQVLQSSYAAPEDFSVYSIKIQSCSLIYTSRWFILDKWFVGWVSTYFNINSTYIKIQKD